MPSGYEEACPWGEAANQAAAGGHALQGLDLTTPDCEAACPDKVGDEGMS